MTSSSPSHQSPILLRTTFFIEYDIKKGDDQNRYVSKSTSDVSSIQNNRRWTVGRGPVVGSNFKNFAVSHRASLTRTHTIACKFATWFSLGSRAARGACPTFNYPDPDAHYRSWASGAARGPGGALMKPRGDRPPERRLYTVQQTSSFG